MTHVEQTREGPAEAGDSGVDVSVVIPVYNQWALTERCLESLARTSEGQSLEVIVVDNGSFDDTAAGLERWSAHPKRAVRALRMQKNLGFARGCNEGARAARGRYLLFLNNDTLVLPGAIAQMVTTLRASRSAGIVGARLLYPSYTIQHAGMAADAAFDWHHVFVGYVAEHPLVLVKRSFQAVTGACLLLEKSLFDRVGAFDEQFMNSHEDVDLCFRVRDVGREVVYEPNAVFIHYESMSAGRTLATGRASDAFLAKWKGRIVPDLEEQTTRFADKMASSYEAEVRALLESGQSPFDIPYSEWHDSDVARRFRELTRAQALCARPTSTAERVVMYARNEVALALRRLRRRSLR